MALEFKSEALNAFRNVNFGNDNAIANLDGKNGIKQNGKLGSFLWKPFRSSKTEANNNAIRTELLKSLGQAFDLNGMSEVNGKTMFSEDFMDNLAEILGPVFKREDFEIGKDGTVSSGKPLTERRIKAIVARADEFDVDKSAFSNFVEEIGKNPLEIDDFSKQEGTGKVNDSGKVEGSVKTRFGGIRKEIYNPYLQKMDAIKKELPAFAKSGNDHVVDFYNRVEKTLDYLSNELDVERDPKSRKDGSALRSSEAYEYYLDIEEEPPKNITRFEYFDYKDGKFRPLSKGTNFRDEVLWKRIGGLIHTENVHFDYDDETSIEPLKKYIVNIAKMFVMKAIDTFFAAKEAGKMDELVKHLESPGACIEEQGKRFIKFEADHLTKANAMSAEDARALENIADGKAADLPKNTVILFMEVLTDFEGEDWFSSEKGWNKEVADRVKDELRGKKCVMQDFNAPHTLGAMVPELINENGLPVVKELTDDLIDKLGPKVLREYFRV